MRHNVTSHLTECFLLNVTQENCQNVGTHQRLRKISAHLDILRSKFIIQRNFKKLHSRIQIEKLLFGEQYYSQYSSKNYILRWLLCILTIEWFTQTISNGISQILNFESYNNMLENILWSLYVNRLWQRVAKTTLTWKTVCGSIVHLRNYSKNIFKS